MNSDADHKVIRRRAKAFDQARSPLTKSLKIANYVIEKHSEVFGAGVPKFMMQA